MSQRDDDAGGGPPPQATFSAVTLELDTEPRVVEMPDDLAAALTDHPDAQTNWATLSYSHQRRHVLSIEQAKAPETRARRVAKAIELLSAGRTT